jgi:hypothetical protein
VSHINKPLIDIGEFNGPGVIIQYPSGVRYRTQAGGHYCHHPESEGIYVPAPRAKEMQEELHRFFYTGPKWRGWCCQGIDEETADFLDELFDDSLGTEALKVNRAKLADSFEAWVHVIVSPDGKVSDMWSGFNDAPGIFTWENSD